MDVMVDIFAWVFEIKAPQRGQGLVENLRWYSQYDSSTNYSTGAVSEATHRDREK